jgi:uncharacterized protein (TIGR02145 family)
MKTFITINILLIITGLSYGQTGSITNINTAQRTDGSMIVDIYYDLTGSNPQYVISVEASFNSGTNFAMLSQVSGDAGAGVTPGAGKHIVWNFGAEFPGSYSTTTKIRIRAYLNNCFYFIDPRDNQEYSTIQIGTQCWMVKNLNIGNMIPGGTDMTDNGQIEKYCYGDNPANCDIYGGLYQWDEMMQYLTTPSTQGICPDGWHLPSYDEYTVLTNYLGGASVAGGKIKETGTTHWLSPNTGATNESGFTALPGGIRWSDTNFIGLHGYANFWISTEYITAPPVDHAWYAYLQYLYTEEQFVIHTKQYGLSVRCLRN